MSLKVGLLGFRRGYDLGGQYLRREDSMLFIVDGLNEPKGDPLTLGQNPWMVKLRLSYDQNTYPTFQ